MVVGNGGSIDPERRECMEQPLICPNIWPDFGTGGPAGTAASRFTIVVSDSHESFNLLSNWIRSKKVGLHRTVASEQ